MSGAVTALDAAEGEARLGAGLPAAVRGRGALIWVEGPDAEGFLQGLLSNDLRGLADGAGRRALLLDARGHVRADLRALREGPEAFTLLTDAPLAEAALEVLERHHVSEDLEIIGPEPVETLTVTGLAGTAGAAAALSVPSLLPGAVDLVVEDPGDALAALGLPEAPRAALDAALVLAGAARVGIDGDAGSLVQELALEGVAVSFDKGCYLGQETVARAQFRGQVKRVLRGIEGEGARAARGAAVHAGGRAVGTLGSSAHSARRGPVALAVVRREIAPGDEVEVEGAGPARLVALPFGAA